MLEVKHLMKSYDGHKRSLTDVSFTVATGEVAAIIGPSGAGKTTILRSINQLIKDDEGQVLLNELDMRQLNRSQLRQARQNIGMIFQNYNLIEPLTAIENVLHGCLAINQPLPAFSLFIDNQRKKKHCNCFKK